MKVLITGESFSPENIQELFNNGIEVSVCKTHLSESQLTVLLKRYDAYVNGSDEVCTRKVIEKNQHLRLIGFMGAGYRQYIDVEAAQEYGIPVVYTPGANAVSVAEYTIALMFDAIKKITLSNSNLKSGEWKKEQVINLEGKSLGIVGMGKIGYQVAKKCHALGMKILYYSPHDKPEVDAELNAKRVALNELFALSDVVSLHAALTSESIHMIGEEQFSQMKAGSILINTARGDLIDWNSLYAALQSGRLSTFATDTYPGNDQNVIGEMGRFLSLPDSQFICTPHAAYCSFDAQIAAENMICEALSDVQQNNTELRHHI